MAAPLPPAWSEYVAPTGHKYYFNAITRESTYIRPVVPPIFPLAQAAQPKKKEKPVQKTPIPGTEWIRVRTNEGNIFYTHRSKKESVWTVPEEIKDAVEELERTERDAAATDNGNAHDTLDDAEKEVERVKREVQAAVSNTAKRRQSADPPAKENVSKKPRVEDAEDEDEHASNDDSDDDSDGSNGSEDEDWQRAAAAQLAQEAEEHAQRLKEEEERLKKEREEEEELKRKENAKGKSNITMPQRVDLSLEEAKALFKSLLTEKNINPLLPWDTSLPLFVSDPRYVLLPSVAARRDAFDEYCRERARQIRLEKQKLASATTSTTEVSSTEAAPTDDRDMTKEEFEKLLKEDVTSTRTSWTDWRRKWKKDRRFWGWGRDDREREKRFRAYVKELGEVKRAKAEKAEKDFFTLLKSKGDVKPTSEWKETKRKLDRDPRYDAVGSSSLREELFNTFKKTLLSSSTSDAGNGSADNETTKDKDKDVKDSKKARAERAVLERESRVRSEQAKTQAEMNRSRVALSREEGERAFMTMLVDAIRDPKATWSSALPTLTTDPRFTHSPLPLALQQSLFNSHVSQLRSTHLKSLHALFASHSSSTSASSSPLTTNFEDLPLETLMRSLSVTKTDMNEHEVKRAFEEWKAEREREAKASFGEMLKENSFVEFWGRVGKMAKSGDVEEREDADEGTNNKAAASLGEVKFDDEGFDEDEGEGGGGRADLKSLAKSIDIREVERVLKNDKRYAMFDHMPQERELWVRDHLSRLKPPKRSVHAGGDL